MDVSRAGRGRHELQLAFEREEIGFKPWPRSKRDPFQVVDAPAPVFLLPPQGLQNLNL